VYFDTEYATKSPKCTNGCSGHTDRWYVQYAYNALYTLVLNPFLAPVVSKLTQTRFEVMAQPIQEPVYTLANIPMINAQDALMMADVLVAVAVVMQT